jgi:hypothetical protein
MTYRNRRPEMHQEEDLVAGKKVALAMGLALAIAAALTVWALSLVRDHRAELRPSGGFPERSLGPRREVARVRQDVFGEARGRVTSEDARARAALSSFGWVDRERGIVRIPVDLAIDLVAAGRRP